MEAVTWQMLEGACRQCPEYQLLHQLVHEGVPEESKNWDAKLLPYYKHRHLLMTVGPVVLLNDRPVVPQSLRARVIDHLHAGHPGLSTMCDRLASSLYWPDYKADLTKSKLSCTTCRISAPSNPALPPSPPTAPLYPFQSVVCDFFTLSARTYVALADRYSNWLSVLQLPKDTSKELIKALRSYFSTFGIPEVFSTDGASIFTSSDFTDFCHRWGIQQRISSAYFPRSNKRAEVAVKSAKRMIRDSVGPGGTLDTDALARALLAHRNTPDSATGLSPAQVIFGRNVRDFMPCSPGHYQPREQWRITAEQRERAYAKRHIKAEEALTTGSKQLTPLLEGDTVSVQDQTGTTPRRWSKTGQVLEVLEHNSYLVKIHGTNKVPIWTAQNSPSSRDHILDLPTDHHDDTDTVDPIPANTARVDTPPSTQVSIPDLVHPTLPRQPGQGAAPPGHLDNEPALPARLPHVPAAPQVNPRVAVPAQYPTQQFVPPQPGVPHYDLLRRREEETRRQAEASRQLSAYLAYIMTNTAFASSGGGGIYSYQPQLYYSQPWNGTGTEST